jgi:guanylate kinase
MTVTGNRLSSVGLPIVISAPSGAGKSTIATHLGAKNPTVVPSISCTTRAPRPGERDGEHYYFVTEAEFHRRIEAKEFLEWAPVHGHYYGTPIVSLENNLRANLDVILTIDPQGALSVKRIYPQGVFIFIVPPSWDVLLKRLYKRATDDKSSTELRLANAKKELEYLEHYDYLVVNDELDSAVCAVEAIIAAEHHRVTRIDRATVSILSGNI